MEVSLEVEYILMVDRWRGISYICFTYMYLLLHSTIRACIEYVYVYKYVRTFIVSSDQRPPVEDVKGESFFYAATPLELYFLICFIRPWSLIELITGWSAKSRACLLPWKFWSHATCSEHTGIQSDCPIVLLFYKLLSKKKTLPVKLNAVPPREMFSRQS